MFMCVHVPTCANKVLGHPWLLVLSNFLLFEILYVHLIHFVEMHPTQTLQFLSYLSTLPGSLNVLEFVT